LSRGFSFCARIALLAVSLVGLAGCAISGLKETALIPDKDQRRRLAEVVEVRLAVESALAEGRTLRLLVADSARKLLAYAGREVVELEPERPPVTVRVRVRDWIDPPGWRPDYYFGPPCWPHPWPRRPGCPGWPSWEADDRLRAVSLRGTITWELEGQPVLSRGFAGNQARFFDPHWPQPFFPTVSDLKAALGLRGSFISTMSDLIGWLYGPEPLIEALGDEDWPLRRHAARALGQMRAQAALWPLVKALEDDHRRVRAEALEALENITGQEFGWDIESWADWLRKNAFPK